MTPLEKPSRKSAARSRPPQVNVRTCMPKLVMRSLFVVVITTAAAPVLADTSAATSKAGYTTTHPGKKHLVAHNESTYYGFRQTPPQGYFGNWGFAPGGYYWDRNYLWRRSLGFWDTNAPACPFRYC